MLRYEWNIVVCIMISVKCYLLIIDCANSISICDLLRDFRFKKVHMVVICIEYDGIVGVSQHHIGTKLA